MSEIIQLPQSEFTRLSGIHDGFSPDADCSIALVALNDGEIVGRVFLVSPAHIEGPWVREDQRGGLTGFQLMARAEYEAAARGIKRLFAYGASPELENYLERLGYRRMPLSVWAKEIAN